MKPWGRVFKIKKKSRLVERRQLPLKGRVFKIYKTPRLVERRQLPLKGAHI